MRSTVVVTIGLLLLLTTARFSFAQIPTQVDLPATERGPDPTPEPPPEDPLRVSSTMAETERQEYLDRRYFELLEQYRTQEQTYIVARNQYLQLNTLASQELAVKETRTLLVNRADIYLVYLERLKMVLKETKGIPLENKSPQTIKLTLLGEVVQLHRSAVASALDLDSIENESRSFEKQIKEIEELAYQTQALVRLGRMQAAYDKLQTVRDAVFEDVMGRDVSAAKKAEKERGFNQIDQTIRTTLADLAKPIETVFTRQQVDNLSQFGQLSSSLQSPYSKMFKTVEYLQEIRK